MLGVMIAVIGCGNANRTDDAVGLEVVRLLSAREPVKQRSDVKLLDAGTDGMAVMFAAQGCSTLIIIDCCRTGAEPGAVFESPGDEVASARDHEHAINLHDFRWDQALFAGRRIFREAFPSDVTAYLIEGANLDFGIGLTPAVRGAAEHVAACIEARITAVGAPRVGRTQ
ncbi:MAG: hydrogenase maturation protease [Hyphomicrobium sp.]